MRYDELFMCVMTSDPEKDWIQLPGYPVASMGAEKTVFLYKPDVLLTIERESDWDEKVVNIHDENHQWLISYSPDSTFSRLWALKYAGNFIRFFDIVSIDNGKAEFFWPKEGKISRFGAALSRILTKSDEDFQYYLNRSNLIIENTLSIK